MTPYFEDAAAGIVIYCGDAREVVPTLDLSGVGVVIADPPYGETSLQWDRWPVDWPDAIAQHVPATASMWCFGSLRMFLERRDQFGQWRLSQDVVWRKHNGSSLAADRFRRVHEYAVLWYRGAWGDVYKCPQYANEATARTVRRKAKPSHHQGARGPSYYESEDGGPKLVESVIEARTCHGSAENETQKPEAIVAPLVRYSCAPGHTVLSPFAGSGTDLLVARALGLSAIGIELREEQCAVAVQRLSQGVLNLAAGAP